MIYYHKSDAESYKEFSNYIKEYKSGDGNWDPEWIEGEVKEMVEYYRNEIIKFKRRYDRTDYFLYWLTPREVFKEPFDCKLPLVFKKSDSKFYIDIDLLLQEMSYMCDNEKQLDIKRIRDDDLTNSRKVVVCEAYEDITIFNKHLIVECDKLMFIAMIISIRIRNKDMKEFLLKTCKKICKIMSKVKNPMDDLLKDIPRYRFEKDENGNRVAVEVTESEKEADIAKKLTIGEYFKKQDSIIKKIKKASDKERNQ